MSFEAFLSHGNRTNKLSERIRSRLQVTDRIRIVSGFLTQSGFSQVFGPNEGDILTNSLKIEFILVGQLTRECANLFDTLYDTPEYRDKLFVNLGFGRRVSEQIRGFIPMVHSKIIALDPNREENMFYIGSANITKYALEDWNAEAGIILKNLEGSRRTEIIEYMDYLMSLPSTKPYDPALREDLVYLSSLPTSWDSSWYFETIDTTLFIICYSPMDHELQPGDIIFADLPAFLPAEIISFHQRIQKNMVIMLFSSLSDLLNMAFDRAKLICSTTQNINNIRAVNRSIERQIDGIIFYDPVLPPLFFPSNEAPEINPAHYHSQMKCNVIPATEEAISLFAPRDIDISSNVNRLVIQSKRGPRHLFETNEENRFHIDGNEFVEITYFRVKPEARTLSDLKDQMISSKIRVEFSSIQRQITSSLRHLKKDIEFYPKLADSYAQGLEAVSSKLKDIMTYNKYPHCFIFRSSKLLKQ